jgi:hypothetical protein
MLHKPSHEPPPATKGWRTLLKVHPAAALFPMMFADELKALGEDIKKNGLTSPIAITASRYVNGNWDYQLLDGRNRLDAMERAGIQFELVLKDGKCVIESKLDSVRDGRFFPPATVVESDLFAYVISANVHRRHLTTQQKLDLLDKAMKAHPSISSRRVAKLVGVSPTTATKSRRKLEAKGDVSTVDTSIDTKGRKQPTRKKRRDIDDYLAEKKTHLEAASSAPQQDIITPIVDTTPGKQMQALASELAQFGGDYCARVRDWREARSDGQHSPMLIRVLKRVAFQLQTLAQEIGGHDPDATSAIDDREEQR